MLIDKPICDKCGCGEFDIICLDKIEENHIPASLYFSSEKVPISIPAMIIYHHYKATCKACGAKYEYTT